MEATDKTLISTKDKPLPPLTPRSYSEDEITWRKHVPWLQGKNFKFVEVPKGQQIEVQKENK